MQRKHMIMSRELDGVGWTGMQCPVCATENQLWICQIFLDLFLKFFRISS